MVKTTYIGHESTFVEHSTGCRHRLDAFPRWGGTKKLITVLKSESLTFSFVALQRYMVSGWYVASRKVLCTSTIFWHELHHPSAWMSKINLGILFWVNLYVSLEHFFKTNKCDYADIMSAVLLKIQKHSLDWLIFL